MVAPCLPAWVRSPSGTDFPAGSAGVIKSSSLWLVARLGPLGHELGFGGVFRGRVKPGCFLLMKNGEARPPGPIFLLTTVIEIQDVQC